MSKASVLTLFALLLAPTGARAFPEMVRHGYSNCVTCHASPNGGGILTEYGRAISKELLSNGRFFFEKKMDLKAPLESQEEQFLGGSMSLPKGLSLGGDIRALQMVMDNKRQSMGRFILMQADLEGAWHDGKRVTIAGIFGRAEPTKKAQFANEFLVSRRHWVSVKMGPPEALESYQLRFGRFFPSYGLNIAEHNYYTRKLLGFDQQQETYNGELSVIAGEWSGALTGVFGRPDKENKSKETGGAIQVARTVAETHKIGVNGYFGDDPSRGARAKRTMAGAFGVLGFGPKVYSLVELDWTHDQVMKSGLVELMKWGYEPWQGVHFLFIQQYAQPSFEQKGKSLDSYTVGLQYFPRAHWDFLFTAGQERNSAVSPDFSSVFLFLAHYYL